jgi:hypothetical protein
MLAGLSAKATSSVTIAWNQSQDTNVVGYKVYSGTITHTYTNVIVVGNTTNTLISGINQGITKYFAVTAYTSSGAESAYSTEVAFYAPPGNLLDSIAYSGSQFSFAVNGNAGSEFIVEASTNLVDWVPLQTNEAPFTFVDANASHFGQRFYIAIPQ